MQKIPFFARIDAAVVAVMALMLTCVLWDTWSTRLDYAFGYLMPVFMLYVIWDRLPKIEKYFLGKPSQNKGGLLAAGTTSLFGGMAVCGFAGFMLFSVVYSIARGTTVPLFGMSFCFAFAFYGLAYFAGAKNLEGLDMSFSDRFKFANFFVFPAFAWMIASPLFNSWETLISGYLLSKVAVIVTAIMDFFGYLVELRGNSIHFPDGAVGVADACSGIRSLTACLFSGSFLAAVFLDKFWKKIALVGMSMVFAFINNIIRALFLSVWAYEYGADSISGFVHDAAGYAVLGLTILCLFILLPLFTLNPVPKEYRDNDESSDPESENGEGGESK